MSFTFFQIRRRPFVLLEVLLAFAVVSLSLPYLFKDVKTYQNQVKQLEFYNEFETAMRREMFFVYHELYQSPWNERIESLSAGEFEEPYREITLQNKTYPITLKLNKKKSAKTNKNHQLSVALKASKLPLPQSDYTSSVQKMYLKKGHCAMKN